tara:strand:+ start:1596 stop:2435 length:840 start_codon:yes stop_codon:yes gene_type:complete
MVSNNGFIYVASKNSIYYGYAVMACRSLKQAYPEANVTLFTHSGFVTKESDIFDNVVTGIPVHERAKMWAMARTPYDVTVYIDVDSQVQHTDVSKLFDLLGDNDYLYTQNPPYTVSNFDFAHIDKERSIVPPLNGSFLVYRKSNLMIEMLETWFSEFLKQKSVPWDYEFAYQVWQQFDMFTIWRLLFCDETTHTVAYDTNFAKFRQLQGKLINSRWNGSYTLRSQEYNGPIVITQIDGPSYQYACTSMFSEVAQIIKGCDIENGAVEESEVAGFTLQIR